MYAGKSKHCIFEGLQKYTSVGHRKSITLCSAIINPSIMRIVIANDQHWPMVSGVATAARTLALGLTRAGHDVLVIAPSQTGGRYEEQDEGYQIVRTRSVRFPFRQNLRISVVLEREVRSILKEFQPDIVHVHTQLGVGLATITSAGKLSIPVVATNHVMPENIIKNVRIITPLAKPVSSIFTRYGMLLYKGASCIIMPTQSAIDLFKNASVDVPIVPISNGIDLSHFRPLAAKKSTYVTFQLPVDRPIVSYVGRLDREKHVHILLHAAKSVLKEHKAHFLIVGDGNATESLEDFAQALGIADSVTFTGRVSDDDLLQLHRIGDIFVMPSPAELQSLALLESMASGKPAIAVSAGALPELCQDGRNGFIVPVDNVRIMSERISRLLGDEKLRKKFSSESLKIARAHDIKNVIKRFEDIYKEVISTYSKN